MGKYIKKFDTHSDYEDFIETEDFIRPNVSYCVDNKDVHYNSIQTLFALEIESGEFISFYFQGRTLYANTDDGSSALWVLDDDGVVVDNISYSIADRTPILAQINEHYGTSFTGWSDNEIGLRIGDPIPNWNAYEKIEMPIPYYAVTTGGTNRFAAGYLDNKVWHVYFSNNNKAWGIDSTGLIVVEMPGMEGLIPGLMLPKMRESGIEVESYVQEVVDWNVGETIPNVQQYTFIV